MLSADREFLGQFEDCSLDPARFDHQGHLRIAFLYLELYPLEDAIENACHGIAAYARSLGATGKFNRTMTEAIMRIIHPRLAGWTGTFEAWLACNPDLVRDMRGLLLRHYSKELLDSENARRFFVPPDIRAFDAPKA